MFSPLDSAQHLLQNTSIGPISIP